MARHIVKRKEGPAESERLQSPGSPPGRQAVHAAPDAYLATLTDEDLTRKLDLT